MRASKDRGYKKGPQHLKAQVFTYHINVFYSTTLKNLVGIEELVPILHQGQGVHVVPIPVPFVRHGFELGNGFVVGTIMTILSI